MIAILDYEAGNLASVELAVRHVGGDARIIRDASEIAKAERVIFPGVGAAAACMANFRRAGFDQALRDAIRAGKPTLAICVGLQLLFDCSEEDGGVPCLGLFGGQVVRFQFPPEKKVKVPHMGWNEVRVTRQHPLLNIPEGGECYFVHSYYPIPSDPTLIYGETEYAGTTFCCAAGRENLFATQFHPEKSGEVGLSILRNFLAWDGQVS